MKDKLKKVIIGAIEAKGWPVMEFVVEHPADLAHGDYATNVALVLAKSLGLTPRQVAEQLAATLRGSLTEVSSVDIAGPGFINFHLSREFFVSAVAEINQQGDDWGRNKSWAGKKVLVEYTDPNPFKEFHVGHLFTNAVGESIARLFMMQGATTLRVNYQGDVGLHVAHAIWGMQQLGFSVDSNFSARDLGQAYALGATKYKEDENVQAETRAINKKIYDRSDSVINALYDTGRAVSLAYFESIYASLDTRFDAYFFESETGPLGKALVEANPDIFKASEGARIFTGEDYGLHTRVFVNKEGLPTYEAKELALGKLKADRLDGYDWSVISTASEVNEYFKVLLKAMSLIYPELSSKTEHLGHGMVRLSTGKMSSRTGQVIAARDFIAEVAEAAYQKMSESGRHEPSSELAEAVAIGAIKYATLRGNVTQNSIFDKDQALSFEGDSGPYLQYSHARINSVLEKATGLGLVPSTTVAPPQAYPVERLVYQFGEVIETAFVERAPHKVTTYLTELAGAFNTFYGQEKLADTEDEFAPYKLALAQAVKQTLKNGLWVLGIKAPERM